MKKIYSLFIVIAVVITAAILIISMGEWMKEEKFNPEEVDTKYLEGMQLEPSEDYIQELTSVVEKNEDPYVRERAIFTLTDIAIRKYETEKIVDFLKEIAMNETEDNVRTAAYANIDLIREIYPLEKKGSLDLSILGDIKKNSNITVIAKVSSKVDVEAIVGIDYLHTNIELLSPPCRKVDLKANESKQVQFDLYLKETGEYFIPFTLMLSFDRIDYETIEDEIHINVKEFSGEIIPHEGIKR